MGHYDVVRRDVGLPVRVAAVAVAERHGAVVGRVPAQHVLELGHQVGLVERRPELHPVAERLEADIGVVLELLPDFFFTRSESESLKTRQEPKLEGQSCTVPDSGAQPANISDFQLVRLVEMVQCHEWLYP